MPFGSLVPVAGAVAAEPWPGLDCGCCLKPAAARNRAGAGACGWQYWDEHELWWSSLGEVPEGDSRPVAGEVGGTGFTLAVAQRGKILENASSLGSAVFSGGWKILENASSLVSAVFPGGWKILENASSLGSAVFPGGWKILENASSLVSGTCPGGAPVWAGKGCVWITGTASLWIFSK